MADRRLMHVSCMHSDKAIRGDPEVGDSLNLDAMKSMFSSTCSTKAC